MSEKSKYSKKSSVGKTNDARKKAAPKNTMISIRIPDDVIGQLRRVAGRKGELGYQQLIKNYISNGLDSESTLGVTRAAETPTAPEVVPPLLDQARTLEKHLAAGDVIRNDVCELAAQFESQKQYFEGKTFLITGAFGFLGRYFVSLLRYMNEEVLETPAKALLLDNFVTGYEQRVICDDNLEFFRHDVIQPFETDEPIDYIIHAAGIASPVYYTRFPIETMDVGTIGTRNMLELARKKNVKSFVFMSSSEVYGDPDPKHVPTKEDYFGNVSMLGPRACYDESKRYGETMCVTYWRVFNVPAKIIRPFNVYGPGIRPDDYRVLPNFIEHALRKEPLPVHGEGHNTRSFCYINDAVETIFKLLFTEANGEAFNIGNPEPEISVRDLAHVVANAMPYKVDVVNIDPPHAVYASSDPKRRCPDISKLQSAIDFKPKYSLEEGLKRTIHWFESL